MAKTHKIHKNHAIHQIQTYRTQESIEMVIGFDAEMRLCVAPSFGEISMGPVTLLSRRLEMQIMTRSQRGGKMHEPCFSRC